MLARLRLSVPDRPGSLGLVASVIGSAGGDIVRVEVLDSEAGRATDDVFVDVRDAAHVDRLTERLSQVNGVQVLGAQHPAPPATGHAELELVARIVSRPEDALQTAVDGAPGAFGADWAALVEFATDADAAVSVLTTSPGCPGEDAVRVAAPLRLRPLRMPRPGDAGGSYGGAALTPVAAASLGLVLVRETGPEFHRSELWRFGQVGEVLGAVLAQA